MTSPANRPALLALALALAALGSACRKPAAEFPQEHEVFAGLLARIDDDRDGRISRQEYERRSNGRDAFEKMDADGDGFATVDELRTAIFSADPGHKRIAHPAPEPKQPVPAPAAANDQEIR